MIRQYDINDNHIQDLWSAHLHAEIARPVLFPRVPLPKPTRWQRLRYKLSLPWVLRVGRYELRFGEPVDD